MDEETAIARMQRGDIQGLETLVRAYQVRAVRAAFLITRERSLAEEVVQAAFLRAYERIGQFDARRPFGPWFLRSVMRDAVKATMRSTRDFALDGATSAVTVSATDPNPEQLLEQAETREEIWAALDALSPAQRSAIVQRYFLELSEAEMVEGLNCPAGTVKSRLHGARERLRLLLRPTLCE